jgi:hypothetical protein
MERCSIYDKLIESLQIPFVILSEKPQLVLRIRNGGHVHVFRLFVFLLFFLFKYG